MTTHTETSLPADLAALSGASPTPAGWVKVSALEVPSGGTALRDLLDACLRRGIEDPHDVADELGLDLGLIRRVLTERLELSSRLENSKDDEAVPVEISADCSGQTVPPPRADDRRVRAGILAQGLDPARAASARLVLKVAATRYPLTIERAKAITRLSGDEFEDILDDLVVSGELIKSVDGTRRTWVRGGRL